MLYGNFFDLKLCARMQTEGAVSAANFLSQSAEAALPKQKRGLAATEFKNAKVAYKRRAKRPTPEQEDRGNIGWINVSIYFTHSNLC